VEIGPRVGHLLYSVDDQPVNVLTSAAEPDRSRQGRSVLVRPQHRAAVPDAVTGARYLLARLSRRNLYDCAKAALVGCHKQQCRLLLKVAAEESAGAQRRIR
jgi:hypothetical protein